jgi:hypothetical protein
MEISDFISWPKWRFKNSPPDVITCPKEEELDRGVNRGKVAKPFRRMEGLTEDLHLYINTYLGDNFTPT